jgi:calcineurin-like phosphoesterase family protein
MPHETVWFTADTHFGQGGAIGMFRRPFKSVAEMDQALVARWNDQVRPDDHVWHLGDFAIKASPDRVAHLLGSLNGCKHLIIGNNDGPSTMEAVAWESVSHYADLVVDGTRMILCHYPFRTWDGMSAGAYNLHGHCHGRLSRIARQIDVGVDLWDYRPISVGDLRRRPVVRQKADCHGPSTIRRPER